MAQNFTDDVFASGHVGQTDLQNMENNFACLKSSFSGPTAPSDLVAGMWWFDTTANILKLRNEANDAWLNIWDLANNKPYGQDFADGSYLDGDQIDIDWNPANYTPDASPAEASDTDDLTAHLKGIDDKLGEAVPDDAITQAKLADYTTGSNIIAAADAEGSSSSTSYTKVKEIQVGRDGTLSVYFQIKTSSTGTAYGRIYVNGAAVGTARSTGSSSYQAYTEDIAVSEDDLVQLYVKKLSYDVYYRNFRLRCGVQTDIFVTQD